VVAPRALWSWTGLYIGGQVGGGRYWAMWATNGSTNLFSSGCPCQTLPARTERYGAFVQASYTLGGLK
jgi:hypothetical protein